MVQVQLQSILQANPLTLAWHGQLSRSGMSRRAPGFAKTASGSGSTSKSFGAVGGASEAVSCAFCSRFRMERAVDMAASFARTRFVMSESFPEAIFPCHMLG